MILIKRLAVFLRIVVPIICFLFSVSVDAQQMNWAFSSGGIGNDNSVVTHVDNSGNVYIGGGFTGTTDFDPSVAVANQTSAGSADIFLAKYNSGGQYLWSFRIGGAGKDVVAAVSTDANGNVYITGYFRGSNVDFDPSGASFNLSSNGDAGVDPGYGGDIFVAKYSSSGQFLWAFNIGGSELYDSGVSIDVDPSSNVYVGGYFRNTVDFDPSAALANLNSSSGTVFLAKYNSAGQYQWAFNLGLGDADNTMFDLKVDKDGNVYTTGFFQGTNRDFDPSPATTAFLSSNGSLEVYVAKYTTNGEYQFAFSIGGNGADIGRGIEIDNSGNIYVIGDFHGSNVDFDPGSGTALLSSSGGADIFLAKYNSSGQYAWAFSFGGPDDDLGWKVSTDNTHLFVTGGFTGTTDLNPSPMVTDNIVSAGGYDIFIGKYNLDGEYLCAFPIGGSGDDFGNSIVSSSTNTFYLTGIIRGSNVDFDPTASTFNLSSTSGDDFFLSKYTWPDNAALTGTLTGETICSGEQARLTFHSDLGTAPFSIVYNDGSQNILVNNVQSDVPFEVTPNPTSTTVYKLVSIRDAARCSESSAVTGISTTITVNSCASVIPSFTAPDTVCVNTPVNITNTSTNASSYYWNFCVADVNTPPTGTNLGNPGNYFSQPVFCDIEEDNGNYCGFVVNHVPGGITRLDFGNSLLNTPTAVFLGNISGVMNAGYGSEGIQIIKNNGNWYGILVGGSPSSGSTPKLITIYFGASLNNPSPTAVSWGNIGNMLQPIDLHVFQENGQWYGLTVNAENNTITRFNFGTDFNNAPSGVNLGNIGGLSYPTGVFALNDNGNWYVFVCNGGSSSITRLDFGNSLLDTPTGVNLGNPNNVLSTPRDITILKYCGQMIGFVNNATNGLVRLNFSSVTSAPTGTDLGNLGNLNFPHSLSKLFRAGNDIYSLITNVNNNTITRLKFTGCTNSSIPNSTAQNPPPITYGIPGTYNINLTVDDGLPTQAATCKQVVVVAPPVHSPIKTITVCGSKPVRIGSATPYSKYLWNTGATTDSINVTSSGLYWVETSRGGCSARDSFMVDIKGLCDSIKITGANKVCSEYDTVTYSIYKPSSCSQQYNIEVDNAFASIVFKNATSLKLLFRQNGRTTIKVAYDNDCKVVTDSLEVAVQFSPNKINLGPDVISCGDTSFLLNAGEGFVSYQWQDGTITPDFFVNAPGMYTLLAQNFCGDQFKDTISVTSVFPIPFTVVPLTATVCEGDSLELKASGGTSYSWSPSSNFNHPDADVVKALVDVSQNFSVSIVDAVCFRDTVVTIPVLALPSAEITISKSNDVNCSNDSAILIANGGLSYVWTPDLYITRSNNGRITVKPPKTTTYYVQSKNADGCLGKDSVTIYFSRTGDQKLYMPNAFTPNGDGLNDIFRPTFIGPAAHYNFRIYNRWGQLIFRTSTPGVGWDGKFNGVIQRSDVYVFYLTAEGDCNGKFEQKGTFVLIR